MTNIVISSGHWKNTGSGANSLINEVTEARKVVAKVMEYLRQIPGTDTEFHDNASTNQSANLNTIVKFHNSRVRDLDLSIHFNAASKTDAPRGVEVLHFGAAQKDLAAKVSKAIADASGLKDRGAKARPELAFLKGTNKPALLIEVCFVDSTADVNIYKAKFNEICKAIAEATTGKKVPAPKPPTTSSTTGSYVVKSGDTLWSIAQANKLTVAELKALNSLKSDTLSIGQALKVSKLPKLIVVKTNNLSVRKSASWAASAVAGTVKTGEAFTPKAVKNVDGTDMYELVSGLWITGSTSHVELRY